MDKEINACVQRHGSHSMGCIGVDATPIYCDQRGPSRGHTHPPPIRKPHHKSRIKHSVGEGFEVSPDRGKETQKVSKQFSKDAFNSLASPCVFSSTKCFQLLWHSRYLDPSPVNSSAAPARHMGSIRASALVRLLREC